MAASNTNRIAALEEGMSTIATLLETLVSQGGAVQEQPAPKGKGKGAAKRQNVGRESTFSPDVARSYGWNGRVGGSFVYVGKRGKSTWKVTGLDNGKGRIEAVRTA